MKNMKQEDQRSTKILPYITGILMAVIFGFSFIFSKVALDKISVMELLFLRFFVASMIMSLLVFTKLIKVNFKGKSIKPILIVAFWQPVAYFVMENTGLKYTSASEAGVMIACIPIVVALLSSFILKEKSNRLQVAFILMSIAGVVIIVFGEGTSQSQTQLKGILLLLCAVFSAAMYNIFSRKASYQFSAIEITYTMMLVGTIVFGGIYCGECIAESKSILSGMSVDVVTAVLYLGIVSSIIAFLFANYTLSRLPAVQSSIFANLTTIVSVIAGVVFRDEQFGLIKLLGTIAILVGVFGTNYFASKKAG